MQVKQPKYIRTAYVMLAAICIVFAPATTHAQNVACNSPTKTIKVQDYDANNGFYNTYATTLTITNTTVAPVNFVSLSIHDTATFTLDWTGLNTANYNYGRNAGYPYVSGRFGQVVVPANSSRDFTVNLLYHVQLNGVAITSVCDDSIFAQPQNQTYPTSGGYTAYSNSLAPPDYPQRIISTAQAGSAMSAVGNTLKDNGWFLIGVVAFIAGLALLSKWLEKNEMGARRV